MGDKSRIRVAYSAINRTAQVVETLSPWKSSIFLSNLEGKTDISTLSKKSFEDDHLPLAEQS